MKKLLLFLVACSSLLAISCKPASAHVGGGPPFLVIDGVYCQTNPYYFNDPSINIPQDYTRHTYLVNKPISLYVDTNQLLVPPSIANTSTFRWTMAENTTKHEYGQKLQYTYTTPGSYIITLEVRAPGQTEYTIIDTVQLDVLPNVQYKLPHATMTVATNHLQSFKPILFQSTYTVDPSTKLASVIWGFGDGTTAKGNAVFHTYKTNQYNATYETYPVIFRVKDKNNFSGYAGVIVLIDKNTLHFVNNLGKENPIPVSDTIPVSKAQKTQNKKPDFLLPLIIGGGIIVAIVVIILGILRIRKKSR